MIVKIQRPLHPQEEGTPCLVYDERRAHMSPQEIPENAMAEMKKRTGIFAMKAFFNAEWSWSLKCWIIGEMVRDQTW